MVTILSFLVVLMVLILAHEVGHLVAAKKLGVNVETFSIGFGPKIARIRKGGTNYVIGLVPLGGYVALGEASSETSFRPGSPWYAERPPKDKIIIALAGPAANFLLAIFVFALVSFMGVSSPVFMDKPADLGWVAADSPAAKAGLRPGDRIIELNGKPVRTWEEAARSVPIYEKKQMPVRFSRQGNSGWAVMPHVSRMNVGMAPLEKVVVEAVAKGSPAEQAGLQAGDAIVAIDRQPIVAWAHFQQVVSGAHRELALAIDRAGRAETITLTPKIDPATGKGFAGVSYRPEQVKKHYGVGGAFLYGLVMTETTVADFIGTVRGLFTGSLSLKVLGGPVAIAQASGSTAKAGLVPLLLFLAFMSIQLGAANLLPFLPVVDGGQVTLFAVEFLRRRPLSRVSLERFAKAGWAAMAVLILFVTYNDVLRLL